MNKKFLTILSLISLRGLITPILRKLSYLISPFL